MCYEGAGRRIPSDIPPHIQQLLEQDRQSFERASPSRRPVYRKILIGNPSGSSKCAGFRTFSIVLLCLILLLITGERMKSRAMYLTFPYPVTS